MIWSAAGHDRLAVDATNNETDSQKSSELDCHHMEVSINGGTPKSSILMGFSLINQPFWGSPFMEPPT